MPRVNLKKDVKPLSEFRANSAAFIKQLQSSGRPMVLTQHGHSAAVLLDVAAYEDMLEKIDVLRDVQDALEEVRDGRVKSHAKAREDILARIQR